MLCWFRGSQFGKNGAFGFPANSFLPNGSARQFERSHGSDRLAQVSVFGSKTFTLYRPVVALHVVAAEDVNASVGQRDACVAVGVVEHALRIAVLLEGGAIQREVLLVEKRRVVLAVVQERGRMTDVEQQLPLHRAVGDDARRHALAQTLPHRVATVGESLERVVRRATRDGGRLPCNWSAGVRGTAPQANQSRA